MAELYTRPSRRVNTLPLLLSQHTPAYSYSMGIKENLKTLMDARRVSQYELARQTGVPQPTIQRILSGESKDPKTATVDKLARFLGVDTPELRGTSKKDWKEATGRFSALSEEAIDLLAAWERLPPERRQAYRDFIFLEVFALEQMPWLKRGRPVKRSYEEYERHMQSLAKMAKERQK